MSFALEPKNLRGPDGTRLRYYVDLAPREADRPVLVIAAGLGGGIDAWAPMLERLAGRVNVVALDYRGLYGSGPAPDQAAYSVAHHAADLEALLDHERIAGPVLAGWSMGVQVNLEFCRRQPRRPRAMIAIHGTFGRPLDTAFGSDVARRVSPHVFDAMRRHGPWLGRTAARLVASERVRAGFVAAAQRLGLMDDALDAAAFARMAEGFVGLDLAAYADIFEHLGEHDASELLPAIRVPTLVIAGGKDRMSPAHLSERMVRELADAELCLLERATHFGLLEYPEIIAARVERFLDERVDGRHRGRFAARSRFAPGAS